MVGGLKFEPKIEKLLDDKHVSVALHQLSSLLIGALTRDQPVQIAHSSLRAYLTRCDRLVSYGDARFTISEVDNSRCLACHCIITLNGELPKHRDAFAILFDNKREAGHIPRLEDGIIAEHVWYACEHWANHIQDIKAASNEMREALEYFQEHCLLFWIAIGAMKGAYFSIGKFYKWSKVLSRFRSCFKIFLMCLARATPETRATCCTAGPSFCSQLFI